ncbi:MAG: Rieske (2Fe-2S) protein [Woeseiaceae bacterium]
MKEKITALKSLESALCKAFKLDQAGIDKEAFVIYFKKKVYAYENSCPHTGINLNWQGEQFFSYDGLYLECSLHGALFEPTTGECVRGPCDGQSLKKVDVEISNGTVFYDEPSKI